MYRVILADPPWKFKDTGTRLAPEYEGRQRVSERPYNTMTLDEICAMRGWVRAIAEDDSFLFLWTPHALVLDGQALRVAREWGFEPKQEWVWVKLDKNGKPKFGGGHYARMATEALLLCRRGKARPLVRNENNVIMAPAGAHMDAFGKRHSAKPDEAYRKIERVAAGPYLELFARRQWSESWDVWGNEAA